jgi:hypothetical protein
VISGQSSARRVLHQANNRANTWDGSCKWPQLQRGVCGCANIGPEVFACVAACSVAVPREGEQRRWGHPSVRLTPVVEHDRTPAVRALRDLRSVRQGGDLRSEGHRPILRSVSIRRQRCLRPVRRRLARPRSERRNRRRSLSRPRHRRQHRRWSLHQQPFLPSRSGSRFSD